MDIQAIKDLTDLNKNDIVLVSKRIPAIHSKLIEDYQESVDLYMADLRSYEKAVLQMQRRNILGETDVNLMSIFKTKEDREVAIRYSEEKIEALWENVCKSKNDTNTIEKAIDFLKSLQNNIRTIFELEKFRAGK